MFFFAEELLGEALLAMLREEIKEMTMLDLVDELFKVSQWFAIVSDGLMDVLIDAHGEELRAKPPEEVQFDELRDFKSIEIPWFSDTRSAVSSVKGLA